MLTILVKFPHPKLHANEYEKHYTDGQSYHNHIFLYTHLKHKKG
jgi:hypothetical protein